jgi:uncharacterized protein involved in tellurium resistance
VITDARFAPKRTDLPWLRRRRLPKAALASSAAPAAPATPDASPHARPDVPLGEFLAGHSTHHRHDEPAPPSPPAPARAPTSATSSTLDLDEPTSQPPAPSASPPPPPPRPVSSSLDLDEPARQPRLPQQPQSSTTSLDLDSAPGPTRPAPVQDRAPARRRRIDPRIKPGERFVMSPSAPTVTLNPLQSGIGTLTVEVAASAEVGDLRLGCAYELANDLELTMQMTQGNRFAPPHSKRPVLVGGHDRFERVQVDLRQCRGLRRLIVYAFSEKRQPLNWGGTLIVTTFGGGRVEVPMDVLEGGEIAVLMSIYQVRGELVLRAEMQTLNGDVREAARAYGFDRISWLDDRTPVE